jgi:spore germination protein YaaH
MRALVAALLLSTPAAAAPLQMAYYEDAGSLPSLKAEEGILNIVAADLISIDENGNLHGKIPANVKSIAAANGMTLLAVVSNYAGNGFNAKIAEAILKPGQVQDNAVTNILALAATGVAGINLDFEHVPHQLRADYTAFTQRLATALHGTAQILALSVPPKQKDEPNNSWAGAYDYAALAAFTDILQVMTYDENGPWGPPGPVSGLNWMTACLTYAETVVPLGEISLGFPAYGYDWNLTKGGGTTVNWNQIPALLQKTGATPQWDTKSSSPYFDYTASNGDGHVVWYENSESIMLKAQLAEQQDVASVSVWALGLEDPSYWQAIASGF